MPPAWIPSVLWLVSLHRPELALLTTTEPNLPPGMNYANVWHDDAVWGHEVMELKVGQLMRHFRSSVFCGTVELPLVLTLNSINNVLKDTATFYFSNLLCTQLWIHFSKVYVGFLFYLERKKFPTSLTWLGTSCWSLCGQYHGGSQQLSWPWLPDQCSSASAFLSEHTETQSDPNKGKKGEH